MRVSTVLVSKAFLVAVITVACVVSAEAQGTYPSGPVLSPQLVAAINSMKPAELRNQHRIHLRRRNILAAHLNSAWKQEQQTKAAVDSAGMSGDMVTVTQQERELYAVRMQIDTLRAELTKENQILALLEQRMAIAR